MERKIRRLDDDDDEKFVYKTSKGTQVNLEELNQNDEGSILNGQTKT